MIAIVDYGMGNLGSIFNMLKKLGVPSKITSDRAAIIAADKLILPGVGAFDTAMRRLGESGLKDVLDEQVLGKKIPTLGVCLGMQLLTGGSEEGSLPGLGWIKGTTKKFRFEAAQAETLKVPHMGWNTITAAKHDGAASALRARARAALGHRSGVLDGTAAGATRDALHGERDLPRSGDAHDGDVRVVAAVSHDRVERAFDQPIDDEVIETARDDGKPRPLRDDEVALEHATFT